MFYFRKKKLLLFLLSFKFTTAYIDIVIILPGKQYCQVHVSLMTPDVRFFSSKTLSTRLFFFFTWHDRMASGWLLFKGNLVFLLSDACQASLQSI